MYQIVHVWFGRDSPETNFLHVSLALLLASLSCDTRYLKQDATMPLFGRNPFPRSAPRLRDSSSPANTHFLTISSAYRRHLASHPFLLFGLPFIITIVAGSFFLTPATAVRYERFDRKTHMLDRGEVSALEGQAKEKREENRLKGSFRDRDIREEYWKLAGRADKLDDWEPVRVKRLEGEMDGVFED